MAQDRDADEDVADTVRKEQGSDTDGNGNAVMSKSMVMAPSDSDPNGLNRAKANGSRKAIRHLVGGYSPDMNVSYCAQ